ncbi:MAG: 16S rRNA (uracil(1498)-N(3))-methyltransferase [Actinomycetaceae bacterium]|nr:16S rRNA (uracil(1498)-N(3))-methyltransferase [Actinomycetaceae bacterium]
MTAPVFFAWEGGASAPSNTAAATSQIPTVLPASHIVEGPEAHHIHVMRLGEGERLDLVDGRGNRAQCTLISSDQRHARVRIDAVAYEGAPVPAITLVQALAKGGRDETAIEMATEVGVDRVIAWQAQRSIVRWAGAKREKALNKWRNTLRAATKQSRRSRIPTVEFAGSTKQLISAIDADRVLVLHENASYTLDDIEVEWFDTPGISVIVGPEGGITDDEVAVLEEHGARTVRIGSTVMRSSTAGTVAIALINHMTKRS